jgi:GT2 family glycosyltransferase
LVVDNLSGDGSFERLQARFPMVEFLQTGANLGYAGGNNRGIEWALERGAARVLVLNDDAEVLPGCLGTLEAALDADPRAAMAAPLLLHEGSEARIWWAGGRWDWLRVLGHHDGFGQPLSQFALPRGPTAVSFVSGCCVLFRAEALRRDGAFREDFGSYVEDLELSRRYARGGWRLLFVPDARALHKVAYPEGAPAAWKIERRDTNRRRVAVEHLSVLQRAAFWPLFVATRLARFVQYALQGDRARAAAILRGLTAPVGAKPQE